jgi:hypothetical protein
VDLRWLCHHAGWRGGLKKIERAIGIRRPPDLDGVGGEEAVWLWRAWDERRDECARRTLERYCSADTAMLKLLAGRLCARQGAAVEIPEEAALWRCIDEAMPGPGDRRSEVGGRRSEIGSQRSEAGGQRSEVGGQMSEIGNQRSEVGGRTALGFSVSGSKTPPAAERRNGSYPISGLRPPAPVSVDLFSIGDLVGSTAGLTRAEKQALLRERWRRLRSGA